MAAKTFDEWFADQRAIGPKYLELSRLVWQAATDAKVEKFTPTNKPMDEIALRLEGVLRNIRAGMPLGMTMWCADELNAVIAQLRHR